MTTIESLQTRDETQFRQLIANQMSAVCAKDVERVMSHYAADVVAFDVKPPFQTQGANAWRRTWAACLPHFPDSFQIETRDLSLNVSGDLAVAHWLFRFTGMGENHAATQTWLRCTVAYRRTRGQWQIIHEHVSVPFDPHTGRPYLLSNHSRANTRTWRSMMIFIYILIAVGVIVLGLVVVAAVQPSEYRVVRSTTIAASPSDVFAQVNDLHKWEAWSPWAKIDPAMKQIYEGAPAGTGAIYTWNGNNQVGEGRMTITESRPSDLIRIKLEFMRPFAGINDVEFTFRPQGDQTAVTWSMAGKKNFVVKAMGLFMSMDKMIGGQFEKGLGQMKVIAEASASSAVKG
jgi:uncharacterized protein (TIGR02246 family)